MASLHPVSGLLLVTVTSCSPSWTKKHSLTETSSSHLCTWAHSILPHSWSSEFTNELNKTGTAGTSQSQSELLRFFLRTLPSQKKFTWTLNSTNLGCTLAMYPIGGEDVPTTTSLLWARWHPLGDVATCYIHCILCVATDCPLLHRSSKPCCLFPKGQGFICLSSFLEHGVDKHTDQRRNKISTSKSLRKLWVEPGWNWAFRISYP